MEYLEHINITRKAFNRLPSKNENHIYFVHDDVLMEDNGQQVIKDSISLYKGGILINSTKDTIIASKGIIFVPVFCYSDNVPDSPVNFPTIDSIPMIMNPSSIGEWARYAYNYPVFRSIWLSFNYSLGEEPLPSIDDRKWSNPICIDERSSHDMLDHFLSYKDGLVTFHDLEDVEAYCRKQLNVFHALVIEKGAKLPSSIFFSTLGKWKKTIIKNTSDNDIQLPNNHAGAGESIEAIGSTTLRAHTTVVVDSLYSAYRIVNSSNFSTNILCIYNHHNTIL